jgi:hypothetical protein
MRPVLVHGGMDAASFPALRKRDQPSTAVVEVASGAAMRRLPATAVLMHPLIFDCRPPTAEAAVTLGDHF